MAKNRISLSAPVPGCSSVSIGAKIAMLLTSAVLSGAASAGFGGMLFICAAAGILAYVMCSGTSIFALPLCAAVSLGFSFLLGVKFPFILIALMYIPMAVVIWLCIRHRRGLSKTVLYLTLLLIFTAGATAGIMYLSDSKWTADFAVSLFNAYKEYLAATVTDAYSRIGSVPQNLIDGFIHSMIMMTPGAVVVSLMAFSYLSAKVCRIAASISDSSAMFEGHRWPVTASLPLTALCVVSSLVAVSATNAVVAFSASNLMLLTLPGSAVFGLNLMFSKNGRLRRGRGIMGSFPLILICIISFYTGGVVLLFFASFYAFYHNIREFIFTKSQKKDQL